MRRRSGWFSKRMPNMSKHSRSIQPAPRYTGVSDEQVATPGPSRVLSNKPTLSSRLSTFATTSSPCSFQSTAVRNEKKRQPSVSFAKRPSSSQRSRGTVTDIIGADVTSTPNVDASAARVSSAVIRLINLGIGGRLPARLVEVRDLILEQQQSVQQRFGRRRAAGHVHVDRNHAIAPLDHVVAVTEGAAGVRA